MSEIVDGKKVFDSFSYLLKPSRLEGRVKVSGAKNSVLKLLAASLLTQETIILKNYPASLLDAKIHVEMLNLLGKKCHIISDEIKITENKNLNSTLDWEGRSIRNTLLILGALVARTGEGAVPLPGGCNLGERKCDLHIMLIERLGAEVWEENGMLCAKVDNGLVGNDIFLPIRSTGATENAIICGTLAKGITRVWNPHIRPEIIELVGFLKSMGALIQVHGQEHIEITGVELLNGTRYNVMPDNMEAITWLVGSVITGGDVEILNFPVRHLEVPLIFFRESGAKFYLGEDSVIVKGGRSYPVEISTGPYPGINSDMQPLYATYGICAHGTSKIVDLRFHGRYGYAEEMMKMGADVNVDGNLLIINGSAKPLLGAKVSALDLRAGVALALLSLVAKGETEIENAWQIERGYDNFVTKMKSLNGDINYEGRV